MTLSKKAVRTFQTQFLLENGYLPVSIDYRLCPEIDLIAGPMTDVRDALGWLREKLPAIAKTHGVLLNPTRIIAVGWSTGGHLAMTTAWTCREIDQEPPQAIISFYGPTDFESKGKHICNRSLWVTADLIHSLTVIADIDRRRAEEYPERKLSFEKIRQSLSTKPVSLLSF